ncbi:Rne/Rng family ribonuclease [Pararhodobacter sp.]|uniref:Rne/Rng family ribonuclease n=1 Tax=Pararhodobacter sp. TaxID=2127056 RepID=UPI002AFFED46|nr:Rne/Rng family ribonuclease [Pararhodobacter sp.]
MGKKLLIDATHAEETRVVVVDGNKVDEFDFETIHKRQLAGNIYLAKITRVEPSLQAAFVDYGGNRHGFLAFAEIHPDYYQIPVADRRALLEEERALARSHDDDNGNGGNGNGNGGNGGRNGAHDSTDAASEGGNPSGRRSRRRRSNSDGDDNAQTSQDADAEAQDTENAVAEPVAQDAGISEHADAPVIEAQSVEAPADGAADTAVEAASVAEADAAAAPGAAPEAETPHAAPEAETPKAAPVESSPAETTDDTPAPGNGRPMAANSEGMETRTYGAMDVVELEDDANSDHSDELGSHDDEPEKPYRAADFASQNDDQIESVADEDVSDEVRPPRRPRARRYKIQEVIKVRQIMLVQVVKEERGNKGAALTTYLSLAGRYCVLMPNTARGGGISRKITNAADRKKLKEIAGEISVPEGAGLIIRTAGAQRTKPEIRRDYEYLFRVWEQIRELTLKSVAPAPIYEEGNLIKRSIRDLYNKDIDEVLVEGEGGYRTAKDFMKMIMPSHAKNVQLYRDQMPLFARFQVESYLGSMFNPTVQLKSGGYIVIGVTEALVAIDVNSGKSTREGSIEDTALKTNLEAADEVARQLRLRDLAGLIVIDFIDMEERKNNAAVEKRMKDALRTDRARIQVGRISAFGLMEMSRQRLRPGMLEATTQPCAHCHGTGLIRSDNSLALQIVRAIEEEGTRNRSKEVLVKAPIEIINYLFNSKRERIAQIEIRYGMAIRLEADTSLISPDYSIEKFKTATRIVAPPTSAVVSFDTKTMSDIDDEFSDTSVDEDESEIVEATVVESTVAEANGADGNGDSADGGDGNKRKRRRRRRRRGGQNGDSRADDELDTSDNDNDSDESSDDEDSDTDQSVTTPVEGADATAQEPAKPVRKRRTRTRKKPVEGEAEAADTPDVAAEAAADEAPAPKKRTRTRRKKVTDEAAPAAEAATPDAATPDAATPDEPAQTPVEPAPTPVEAPVEQPIEAPVAPPVETPAEAPIEAPADTPLEAPVETPSPDVAEAAETAETAADPVVAPVSEPEPPKPAKPRRIGWWSRG